MRLLRIAPTHGTKKGLYPLKLVSAHFPRMCNENENDLDLDLDLDLDCVCAYVRLDKLGLVRKENNVWSIARWWKCCVIIQSLDRMM